MSTHLGLHTRRENIMETGHKEMLVLKMFHEQGVYDHPFYSVVVDDDQQQ